MIATQIKFASVFSISFFICALGLFAQPVNDDKVNAIFLTNLNNWCSTPMAYTNSAATYDVASGSCWQDNAGTGDLNVWFEFVAPASGEVTIKINTASGGGNMRGQQLALLDAANTEIACQAAPDYFYGEIYISEKGLVAGNTYYITVDSRRYDGAFTLCIDNKVNYDFKEGAIAIPSIVSYCSSAFEYDNLSATSDQTAGSCWQDNGGTGNKNVWFSFTATATTNVNFKVTTSSGSNRMRGQQVALWDGAGTQLICMEAPDWYYGDFPVSYSGLTAGNTYYISVDSRRDDGYFTLCIDENLDFNYKSDAVSIPSIAGAGYCSGAFQYNNLSASPDETIGTCWQDNDGTGNKNVWFSFTATSTTNALITITTASGSHRMRSQQIALFDVAGTELNCMDSPDWFYGDLTLSHTGLVPGNVYYIAIDAHRMNGTFTICVEENLDNDFKSQAINIPSISGGGYCSGAFQYTNRFATPDETAGTCWNNNNATGNKNVWFSFTATATTHVKITVTTASGSYRMRSQQVAIFDGTGTELNCMNSPDWYYGVLTLSHIGLTAGTVYYIAVDASRVDGSFTICVDEDLDYDYKSAAEPITQLNNWCSTPSYSYTTRFATPDETAGACWSDYNAEGNDNVWFTFNAIATYCTIDVNTASGSNRLRSQNFSLWDAGGTELACYSAPDWYYGTGSISYSGLTAGNTYYISVDAGRYSGYFDICVDNVGDTIYWVGDAVTSDWSDSDNWSDVSGGNGTSTSRTPQLGDYVFFDGADANAQKNCTLDIPGNINAIEILSGYPGSIDLNTNNLTVYGVGLSDFQAGSIVDNVGGGSVSINTIDVVNFRGTTFNVDLVAVGDLKFGGSTFNGSFTGTRTGTGNTYNTGTNTFNADFEFIATQTSGYFWMAGNDIFNGNITVNSTTNQLLVFEGATLANSKNISIGSTGFSDGSLQFRGFTQLGNTAQTINLTGTATAHFSNASIFNGSLTVNAPNLALNGITVNGAANFTTTNSGTGTGGNTFNNTCSITHTGSNAFRIGMGTADVFNNTLTLINSGADLIDVCNSGSGHQFNGDIMVNSTSGFGVTISGGGGTSTLNTSATITIGGTGFTVGTLTINGLTQTGTGPLSFSLTGNTSLSVGMNSVFNGVFTSTSPNVFLNGATFNNTTNITKTNGVININTGGNTFNGVTTLTHDGPWGQWRLAANADDDFNADVTFAVTGGGDLFPAYAQNTTFAANIYFNAPTNDVRFGEGGGTIIFDGPVIQYFDDLVSSLQPEIYQITMNGTGDGLTLNRPMLVNGSITFIDGVIFSSSTNKITLASGGTVTGASNASFVSGPMNKIGEDMFTFPVGDATTWVYAPITISAPNLPTDVFTASYFNQDPDAVGYDVDFKDGSVDHVSTCEYWILDRTAGTSNVDVTLSWDTRSCGINLLADLLVVKWDGVQWKDCGHGSTTGNIGAGTVGTSAPVTSFSPFTLASISANNSLPIELVSFQANLNIDQVDLKWVTAAEINNDYFTVEKSKDGIHFTEVLTTQGAGTTNQEMEYFEVDFAPLEGVSYYRLKQTDFNGDHTYSNVVPVKYLVNSEAGISVFPNPATGNHVDVIIAGLKDKEVLVSLRDIRGVEYYSKIQVSVDSDRQIVGVDLSGELAAGTYLVTLSSENALYSQQLIIK